MNLLKDLFSSIDTDKKHEVGVVLSGGGARGYAHIGALQALEEYDIKPSVIAGVSAGAIVGALYADGQSARQVYDTFKEGDLLKYASFSIPKHGLMQMRGLTSKLQESLTHTRFEDMEKELYVIATNFSKGKSHTFSDEGDILEPILASASVPILFSPVEINGEFYVDGGLMNNLPAEVIRKRCERLIAIHVNPLGEIDELKGLGEIAERVFHLSIAGTINKSKESVDLLIEPENLMEYGILDFGDAEAIYKRGYESTLKILKKLKDQ